MKRQTNWQKHWKMARDDSHFSKAAVIGAASLVLFVLAAQGATPVAPFAQKDGTAAYVQDRILIRVQSAGAATMAASKSDLPFVTEIRPLRKGNAAASAAGKPQWVVAELDGSVSVEEAMAALAGHDQVLAVEPDFLASIPTPVEGFVPGTLATYTGDPMSTQQWALDHIRAHDAWTVEAGDPAVVVAIIDTGIDLDHPELQAQLWVNPGETVNGIDDDGNGYVDDVLGYDFVNGDQTPDDDNEHGSHVAGIVAAIRNNSIGVAGTANVKVMALKVLNFEGTGSYSAIAEAINYAVDNGADVINMSLGGGGYSAAVEAACQYAAANNVVVLAASGNESTSSISFPSSLPSCIAVGAVDINNNLADFSNYGYGIELVAPGVDIASTVPHSDYASFDGTSMASPYAAGVAALMRSAFPAMSAADVRAWLAGTATDQGVPGYDTTFGYGCVDAYNAVTMAGSPVAPPSTGPDPSSDDGYEENDEPGQAADIGPGTYSLQGLDADWFTFSVGSTSAISVSITGPGGDLDLYLFGPDASLLDSSEGYASNETVSVANGDPGTYWVLVQPYQGGFSSYTLEMTLTAGNSPQQPGDDDLYEQNDNMTEAKALTPGQTYNLVCNDDDWFACNVPAGQSINVKILGNQGDLDLYLYDASGNLVDYSESSSSNEQVTGLAESMYYIAVTPYNSQTGNYQLSITTGKGGCGDGAGQTLMFGMFLMVGVVTPGRIYRASVKRG